MITSKQCWMQSECKKYTEKCANNDIFCIKEFKLDCLYNKSLLTIPQRKKIGLHLDCDGTDRNVFNKLSDYQKNILNLINSGGNIYIYSTITGNGKTAWAVRLMQSYFNKIWVTSDLICRGLFINVPRYLLAIKDDINSKNEYANYIKNNVYNADIVIWDDIGTKVATSFEHENLLSIIDYRILNSKSNIYTSNISCNELKEIVGDRLYSRIVNNSDTIEFHGQDKRSGIIQ